MHGWNGGWLGFVWMFLFLAVIVIVVYAVVRTLVTTPARSQAAFEPPAPGPLEILAERFASGDISSEEYTERRRVLEASGT